MTESSTLDERLITIENGIKDYLSRIGARIKPPERVDEILSISYEVMQKLGYEECGENAFILSQQAYYLQQEYNFYKNRVDWAESSMLFLTAKYCPIDNYMKNDEKAARLAVNNTVARSLLNMIVEAKVYVSSLSNLSTKIEKIAESYKQLQFSKRQLSK